MFAVSQGHHPSSCVSTHLDRSVIFPKPETCSVAICSSVTPALTYCAEGLSQIVFYLSGHTYQLLTIKTLEEAEANMKE